MIVLHELTKRFTTANGEVSAVDALSLRISPGEVFGLLGPNGAGKTTTLRMILGLLTPTSGDAEVDGYRVSEDSYAVKRRIGFVSANVGVYPWLSPREVLAFVADLYGVQQSTARERTQELAAHFGFRNILDQRCGTLSTGQKQRVNLARALIHDPPVILMDEPTRGLDVVGSHVIFEYIAHLRTRGKAVVLCTHRLDEAERLCDEFGLLHEGRLRHHGTLAALQRETGHEALMDMFIDLLQSPATETAT